VAGWLGIEALAWPDVASLARTNPTTSAFIERDARRRGKPPAPIRWTAYAGLSPHLKRAVLVGEDINFFHHDGFDRAELQKALDDAWKDREMPRGASTITQQLARNLWLSPSRNPLRKVKEAILARQLERHLSKHRILEIYLNVAEFGPETFGATAAARRYFDKSPADLTEREAAELAAGLPRPSSWHPGATGRGYLRRVERLLGRMEKAQHLWKSI
jgi:monofunctional biosynthetic peptidoglycan transglycosylase